MELLLGRVQQELHILHLSLLLRQLYPMDFSLKQNHLVAPGLLSGSQFSLSVACPALSVDSFLSDLFEFHVYNCRKVCPFSGRGMFFGGMLAAAYLFNFCAL